MISMISISPSAMAHKPATQAFVNEQSAVQGVLAGRRTADGEYMEYDLSGCDNSNEIGAFALSKDECLQKCTEDTSCVSVEYKQGEKCNLSTTCKPGDDAWKRASSWGGWTALVKTMDDPNYLKSKAVMKPEMDELDAKIEEARIKAEKQKETIEEQQETIEEQEKKLDEARIKAEKQKQTIKEMQIKAQKRQAQIEEAQSMISRQQDKIEEAQIRANMNLHKIHTQQEIMEEVKRNDNHEILLAMEKMVNDAEWKVSNMFDEQENDFDEKLQRVSQTFSQGQQALNSLKEGLLRASQDRICDCENQEAIDPVKEEKSEQKKA